MLDNWQVRRQLGGSPIVAYGNGRFVCIAPGYTAMSLVSTNGIDWKGYLLPETAYFQGLTFANGNFLLVQARSSNPDYGIVLYSSTNGVAWTLRHFQTNSPFGTPFASAGGGNGIYVLTGWDLVISTNLDNWTTVEHGAIGATEFAYGNGLIVGTYWSGSALIASSDGLTWEYIGLPTGFRASNVCYGNGRFAAFTPAAADGSSPAMVGVSYDAENWNTAVLSDFTNATGMVSANDKFFLLNSVSNGFSSSGDGFNWETHSFGTNMYSSDLVFGANSYIAVGDFILQSAPSTNLPAPSVLSIRSYPGITVSGTPGQHYRLEFSEDLLGASGYQSLTNFLLPVSPFLVVDSTATNAARRFYRAVQAP